MPIPGGWDDDVHGSRYLCSLDYGDPRTDDSMPLTHPNAYIRNPADTPNHISDWNVFTQTPSFLLSQPSVMQPIEPRGDRDSWLSHPILPSSPSTTRPCETDSSTDSLREGTIMSLKERVQAMANADSRHIPLQEKRRDAFIQIRLGQLDAEDVGAVSVTAPKHFYGAEQDYPSDELSLSMTQNGNRSSAFLHRAGRNQGQSTANFEVDEADIETNLDPSSFGSGSSHSFASDASNLDLQGRENSHRAAERQREGNAIQVSSGTQLFGNSSCTEMVWSQDMNPLTQRPKRTRTKEDRETRLAVRRNGGACPRHKASKKAVIFSSQRLIYYISDTNVSSSATVSPQDITLSRSERCRPLLPL